MKKQDKDYNKLIKDAYKAYKELFSKVDLENAYIDMPFIVRNNLNQPVIYREIWVKGKKLK